MRPDSMPQYPASFKGIALFTPAGDLVYCIDLTKQGRWHAQLCHALQTALKLPEPPHFLIPCYTATVDRWWDEVTNTWVVSAEVAPNVYRYRALLNQIFQLGEVQWQMATIGPGICDPLLLYRYQEQFPVLWESHNLALPLEHVAHDRVAPQTEPLPGYVLKLFVAGHSQKTATVLQQLHAVLETSLQQPYTLSVVDIVKHPEEAEAHQILATPTLLKLYPLPEKRLVGRLDDVTHLLRLLGIAL